MRALLPLQAPVNEVHPMTHHPTTHHDLLIGFWVTCDCKWSGPARPAKHLATMTHETHVKEAA